MCIFTSADILISDCFAEPLLAGIAVTGGALLSQYISEKVIGYIGGTLFVVFSITTAIGIF